MSRITHQLSKIKTTLLALMCVAIVSACSSNKPQINVDETQNFADIKTFYTVSYTHLTLPTILLV